MGTVEKFQGQEGTEVLEVFYSLATSNPEDGSRGLDSLFSLTRFGVATSRAQAIVVRVASPRLLEAQYKMPKQMRLVNGVVGLWRAKGGVARDV